MTADAIVSGLMSFITFGVWTIIGCLAVIVSLFIYALVSGAWKK